MIKVSEASLQTVDLKKVQAHEFEVLYNAACNQNAEPTGRLLPHNDDRVEFASQLRFEVEDSDGDVSVAVARVIFYQPKAAVETREDLSDLSWTPDHFEIVY